MRAGRRAGHFGSTAARLGQARAAYLGHTCDAIRHGLGAGGLQTQGQGYLLVQPRGWEGQGTMSTLLDSQPGLQ